MQTRKQEDVIVETTSTLSSGLTIQGRVTGDGNLAIEGTVDGEVAVQGGLFVAAGARVHGSVAADAVTVEGELDGDIVASGPVHAMAGAKLKGNISGEGFSMEDGAEVAATISADFDMPKELQEARQ